jgi:mannose-6-phosphate isomerase-like protein (cupin superfamily)
MIGRPGIREFRWTTVATDESGQSRFEDGRAPMTLMEFSPPAGPLDFASLGESSSVAVIASDDDWRGDVPHPAPARQLMVVLQGRGAITVSDGERREFGPGECVLVEETSGAGHASHFSGETRVLVVRLDQGHQR